MLSMQVRRILCHAQVRSGHCGVSGDDWHLTESAGLHEVSDGDSAAVKRKTGVMLVKIQKLRGWLLCTLLCVLQDCHTDEVTLSHVK